MRRTIASQAYCVIIERAERSIGEEHPPARWKGRRIMTTSPGASGENTYIINTEDAAEMARLLDQDMLTTRSMGGLFPERSPHLEGIHNILDVACGPGGWVLSLAKEYPDIEVTGVDISERMIRYAQAFARAQGLRNAHFRLMNILKPMDFASQSFDMINARLLEGLMTPATWPALLEEMVRVCRPGGTIRLTETEGPITTSPAFERLSRIGLHTAHQQKRCFAPDERNIGITAVLGRMLLQAGCQHIQKKAHVFDLSAEAEDREGWFQNWTTVYDLARPFFLNMGLITDDEFKELHQQMVSEMLADDFGGVFYGLTVWGERP